MSPSAVLLGSISSVVDTSELQRRAFNEAFSRHGLDWEWDRDALRVHAREQRRRGPHRRVRAVARRAVDADAVHATKSEIFQEALGRRRCAPGPAWPRPSAPRRSRG